MYMHNNTLPHACTHTYTQRWLWMLWRKTIKGRDLREGQGNGCFRLSGQKRPKEMSGTMPCAGGSSSEQTRSDSCLQGVSNLEMTTKIKLSHE